MTDRPEIAEAQSMRERLARVRDRIRGAAERSGRASSDITLIAVSKTQPADAIAALYDAGVTDFGENRVQEAASKIRDVRTAGARPRWHMIGHLQRNKVPTALGLFDILHGVDSEMLAAAISERATSPIAVLIEVNVAGEASKFGVSPEAAMGLVDRIGRLPHVDLRGLMTVAPRVDNQEDARPVFRRLRELRDAAGLRELSMGMSDDFDVAIEEGSTLVRVGRAVFGDRVV